MTGHAPPPPQPGRTELAAPVPGGWIQVAIDAQFIPDGEQPAPGALATAADYIRQLDPAAIREAATPHLLGLRADPYAAALAVIADMLDQDQT